MDNFFNIYNENYGKVIKSYKNYIAVGNPNSYIFDINDGFARLGEVTVYKKDISSNGYIEHFKCTSSLSKIKDIPLYISSSYVSNSYVNSNIPDDAWNYSILYQSSYGTSIDLYNNLLVVGDHNCLIEKSPTIISSITSNPIFLTFGKVDIYDLNTSGSYKEPLYTFDPYSNLAKIYDSRFGTRLIQNINNNFCAGYGYSVAISNNYIYIGCPFSIDTNCVLNNNINPYKHGIIFAYQYTYENNNLSILNPYNPFIICPNESDIEYIGHSYTNLGSVISANKDTNDLLATINISSFNKLVPAVFLFDSSNKWSVKQQFTGSITTNSDIDFTYFNNNIEYESYTGSFGASLAFNNKCIIIGSPVELKYNAKVENVSPLAIHLRGSAYIYTNENNIYTYYKKIFGGDSIFNDNLFGISVDTKEIDNINYIAVGSPRVINNTNIINYYSSSILSESGSSGSLINNILLYSSLYLSASLDYCPTSSANNIYNSDSYNGQVVLYELSKSLNNYSLNTKTSYPISSRKILNSSFNAFGYSVALSNTNIAVGAPCPLFDDLNARTPYEQDKQIDRGSIFTSDDLSDINVANSDYSLLNLENEGLISKNLNKGLTKNNTYYVNYESEIGRLYGIQGTVYFYNYIDLIKNFNIGNVFYNNNRIVINTDGEICNNLFINPNNLDDISLHGTINSRLTLHEKQYICTINPGEFNNSTNLTARKVVNFNYSITSNYKFTFTDLDYILRYISYINNNNEGWWNYIIEDKTNDDGIEESIFLYYKSTVLYNFDTTARLTQPIISKISEFDLDINNDGIVNLLDAAILWEYFINLFTINNYKKYITADSKRKTYDDIISFLDKNCGKNININLLDDFFSYTYSSSIDPTGSYLAPYITQVGLYNNADLLAIGKLGNPIKNTGEIPINIVVKWDI